MLPAARNGDVVMAWRKKPQAGDVVIFYSPSGNEAIKRVKRVTKASVFLCGDNRHDSFDSQAYGAVPKSAILGVVMAIFRFAHATPPPKLAIPQLFWVPMAAGVMATLLVLTQLGSFEAFSAAVKSYGLFSTRGAIVLALFIAAFEILALPALFRLMLSPAMRYICTGAIMAAPLLWLLLTSYAFLSGHTLANTGLFGGILKLPAGLLPVMMSALLLVAALASLCVLVPVKQAVPKTPHARKQ